jgi:hypothetical protein
VQTNGLNKGICLHIVNGLTIYRKNLRKHFSLKLIDKFNIDITILARKIIMYNNNLTNQEQVKYPDYVL